MLQSFKIIFQLKLLQEGKPAEINGFLLLW